tara:strand:+ start:965 stop:1270 length:306 start_codon:yes stop_codon:yes gene_type:complete
MLNMDTDVKLYRILYRINKNKIKNYHYFIAKDAKDAVGIEVSMTKIKGVRNLRILNVDKWDKYRDKWMPESSLVKEEIEDYNSNFELARETIWAKIKNLKN